MAFVANSAFYDQDLPEVKKVRHAVEGEAAIKREDEYLPHPNQLDKTSDAQLARYAAYKGRAEFDSSCGQTKIELMGAFTRASHEIDLPAQVKYLESDSDGDWLSLADSINVTAGNCLEVKYHILLAEYESGEIPEGRQLSKAEAALIKQRSKIVHYPREAMTNWDFGVVNGRMQLTHVVLTTESTELNDNFQEVNAKTQLLLNLDENGYYRQKLIIQGPDKQTVDGEWIYPTAKGSKLDFIPIEIVVDERTYAGKLPRGVGYLGPIALKDIARYQVNADLKEKLAILQDTIISKGWTTQAWEEFQVINGRSYVATGIGVSNQFPTGVEIDVLKLSSDGDAHFKYIEENSKQTRALGGRYDTDDQATQQTATEAAINSAKENAVLTMIATNAEQSYRRLVAYCCQFEGLIILPEDVAITVNRQFFSSELSPEKAAAIIQAYDARLISKESAVKQLKGGGFGDADLTSEEELDLIDQETPDPLVVPPGGQNNVEVQQ